MFRWEGRSKPLVAYLDDYLADPQWVHGVHVVPLLAWLVRGENFWPEEDVPEEVVKHLAWSLAAWSAFRGGGRLEAKLGNFRNSLPQFVVQVRAAVVATGVGRLSDVPSEAIQRLADALELVFSGMANAVKQNESFVLPAKTAHLLFPSMVPAFDVEVVSQQVLDGMLPARLTDRRTFAMWLRLCSQVLAELKAERTLDEACRRVRDALMDDWSIRVLDPRAPERTDRLLPGLESFVAEYILIALSRADVRLLPGIS
jgi:hypothetical protein